MPVATQTAIGVTGLFLAMQAAWTVIGPDPAPIMVHELAYDAGYIVQDRTVTSDGPFRAVWEAQVLDVATGLPVAGCTGSGVWDYQPGRIAPRIPLAEWVGSRNCILQPGGAYLPLATYSAGEFKTVIRGEEFTVR